VIFLTEDKAGVGMKWRQVRTVFGRPHSRVMRIDVWDQPNELVTSAAESGARYVLSYRLEPRRRKPIQSTRAAMERDLASFSGRPKSSRLDYADACKPVGERVLEDVPKTWLIWRRSLNPSSQPGFRGGPKRMLFKPACRAPCVSS
jgi:hypothetical protein